MLVSITRGNPRLYIWTLAAGLRENAANRNNCPCDGGPSAPSFVGDNYYCESGYNGTDHPSGLLTSDPLWDGAGCESEGSCCRAVPSGFIADLVNSTIAMILRSAFVQTLMIMKILPYTCLSYIYIQ